MAGREFAFESEASMVSDGRRSKRTAIAAIGGTAGSIAGRPVGLLSPLQLRAKRPTTQTISVFGSSAFFFAQQLLAAVVFDGQQDSTSSVGSVRLPVEQQQGAESLTVKQPHDLPQRPWSADDFENAGKPTSETSWAQDNRTARAVQCRDQN